MLTRLLGTALALVVASGCVVWESEFEEHVNEINQRHEALEAWLGSHDETPQYKTVMEWVLKISNVVCDLEDLDNAHETIVEEELCADGADDPTSPPPDPPPLGSGG